MYTTKFQQPLVRFIFTASLLLSVVASGFAQSKQADLQISEYDRAINADPLLRTLMAQYNELDATIAQKCKNDPQCPFGLSENAYPEQATMNLVKAQIAARRSVLTKKD
jgi:hypothetical protein